jgi:hypothetical protein
MMNHESGLGEAFENAVEREHLRAAVGRALATWEAWVVALTALYLAPRLAVWAMHGFAVLGRL